MAKQIGGILGGYSGRVGSVIGYMRGRRWCVRAMPQHVANPRTEAQQRHRMHFREQVRLAAAMRQPLVMTFTDQARAAGMTAYNLFVHLNQPCFANTAEPDYAHLQLSRGPIAPAIIGSTTLERHGSTQTLRVSFGQMPTARLADRYDTIYIYLYAPRQREGYLHIGVYRYAGEAAMLLPESMEGEELHVYAMARDTRCQWSATTHATVSPTQSSDGEENGAQRHTKNGAAALEGNKKAIENENKRDEDYDCACGGDGCHGLGGCGAARGGLGMAP